MESASVNKIIGAVLLVAAGVLYRMDRLADRGGVASNGPDWIMLLFFVSGIVWVGIALAQIAGARLEASEKTEEEASHDSHDQA